MAIAVVVSSSLAVRLPLAAFLACFPVARLHLIAVPGQVAIRVLRQTGRRLTPGK